MLVGLQEHGTDSSRCVAGYHPTDSLDALKLLYNTVVLFSITREMQRDYATNQLKHFAESVKVSLINHFFYYE